MADAVLALNAGSSSLKFETFILEGSVLARAVAGIVEELDQRARFHATRADGTVVGQERWDRAIGHDGALAFLLGWLDDHGGGQRVWAGGHPAVDSAREL